MLRSRILKLFRTDGHSAELLRGSSVAMLLRVIGMLATYLFNFLVARQFGASAVGAFAVATSVVMILGMFARVGLDRAIVRFVASSVGNGQPGTAAAHYRTGLYLIMAVGTALSILMYFGAEFLAASVFDKPHLSSVFMICAPAVLLFSLSLYTAESLRGLKRIASFASLRYVAIYAFAVPVLFLFAGRIESIAVPIAAYTVAAGIAALIGLVLAARHLPRSADKVNLAAMLSVAMPMFLSNSMGMIISWTDVLMLGRYVSDAQVGVYSITIKLAFVTSIVLNAVNSISTPKFAEIHSSPNSGELASVMAQTTRLLFFTAVPILLVLLLFGEFILGIFGDEFRGGYVALCILIVGQFVSTLSGPVGNLMQMTGNEKTFLKIVIGIAVSNIVLNVLLIPRFGIVGAAIASATTLTANNLICVAVIRQKLGFVSIYNPFGSRT